MLRRITADNFLKHWIEYSKDSRSVEVTVHKERVNDLINYMVIKIRIRKLTAE